MRIHAGVIVEHHRVLGVENEDDDEDVEEVTLGFGRGAG